MSKDQITPDRQPTDSGDPLPVIHEAMRSLGWTVPQCEEDVLCAEAELAASPSPLPADLHDPNAAFQRRDESAGSEVLLPFPGDADIDATLARAAREAGHIPPEIEQAMRRDREAAERKHKDAQEDQ